MRDLKTFIISSCEFASRVEDVVSLLVLDQAVIDGRLHLEGALDEVAGSEDPEIQEP